MGLNHTIFVPVKPATSIAEGDQAPHTSFPGAIKSGFNRSATTEVMVLANTGPLEENAATCGASTLSNACRESVSLTRAFDCRMVPTLSLFNLEL